MPSRIFQKQKPNSKAWRKLKRLYSVLWRFTFWGLLSFILLSIVLVFTTRWVPVNISGIQIQRHLEASTSNTGWNPKHQWLSWESISPSASLAVIASEDQRFFDHFGFDTEQIKKAIADSQRGKSLRGASTISQQTAKNVFLWNGRSFVRKGLEAWFTLLIELLWPKQRILEVYLNSIEFGTGIFGIEAASQQFFQKSARHLNPYEAAMLAVVLPNPHRMVVNKPSPYMLERRNWIVNQMNQLGGVTFIENKIDE